MADITIVDNITRAIPNMIRLAREMRGWDRRELENVIRSYDNRNVLRRAILAIRDYLTERAGELE